MSAALSPAGPVSRDDFRFLQRYIKQRTGIILGDDKIYLAETRLPVVQQRHGCASLTQLVNRLRAAPDGPLSAAVIDAFTTNETSFFRDRHPFELLAGSVMGELIQARRSTQRLRLWSAASSTGQEAYSLAILLHSRFRQVMSWDVEILGTDICTEVLETAEAGLYRMMHLQRGLSDEQRDRYFTQEGRWWRVSPQLRALTRFEPINLCLDAYPDQQFDLIMLRNVLIYFDEPTRQDVLRKLHARLAPDGVLFLGGTEAALHMPEGLYQSHLSDRTIWHSPKAGSKP